MVKIYTKSGDRGETSLFTGERVPKNDPLIDALGNVDECNSTIGLSIALFSNEPLLNSLKEQLETIQHALFDVGAALATPRTRSSNAKINKTRFGNKATETLEHWIDAMQEKLPPLKTFILPGGHPAAASLQQARSICRHAERIIVPLNLHAEVSDNVMSYLNRLSDYLFVAARHLNHLTKTEETIWKHHAMDTE